MRQLSIALAGVLFVSTALAARAEAPPEPSKAAMPAPLPASAETPPKPDVSAEHGSLPAPTVLRGAGFRFQRDGNRVIFDMRCAERDVTKACVDAAAQLFDKLQAASQPK